jgi:pimeloyl-ACP methyl ester carboxylesterase
METVLDRDVVVDGVRIAYRDGEGDGRPVVLVHGTPSHSYIWREIISLLESEGYRILAFDLLGYGLSRRGLWRGTPRLLRRHGYWSGCWTSGAWSRQTSWDTTQVGQQR